MKREFLKNLNLTDDAVNAIMAELGKEAAAAKALTDEAAQKLTARETEAEELRKQLAARDADMKTLREQAETSSSVKTQLDELRKKYDTDTAALNKALSDQKAGFERDRATEKFFADTKFSSAMAKEAAVSRFRAQNLEMKDGAFIGAKEWLDALKKDAPDAFAQEEAQTLPQFGGSVHGAAQKAGEAANPFGFSFGHVRKTD